MKLKKMSRKLLSKYENRDRVKGVTIRLIANIALCAVFILSSCKDESIIPDAPEASGAGQGILQTTTLPGIIGLSVFENDTNNTRAGQSSDGKPFSDGLAAEYALAAKEGAEYYHYLLLYDEDKENSLPLIFPIDVDEKNFDGDAVSNITLTVSKVFKSGDANGELNGNESFKELSTKNEFSAFIRGMKPYVLMNFKLTDSPSNYSLNGGAIAGTNTVEKLSKLKKSDLESLIMTDYKTRATSGQNFFIMSNSVYSDFTKKVIDGTVFPEHIYSSVDEAKRNPGMVVHVERLASKVTVSFNTTLMGNAVFDPYDQKQKINPNGVSINASTGLPELSMTVEKVDMTEKGGIKFDSNGYEIQHQPVQATLRVIGYGLSNLETNTRLIKDINYLLSLESLGNWQWTDQTNHRSYWTRDLNYGLVRSPGGIFTKVTGYPHQFRLALDTDSVTSYHGGEYFGNTREEYTIPGSTTKYYSYSDLGQINLDDRIDGVVLNYKSFNQLYGEFSNYRSENTSGGVTSYSFSPLYSLENSYYDQGQLTTGAWVWPWNRAPYAVATNLIILAEIQFDNNAYTTGQGESNGSGSSADQAYDGTRLRDVYLGQNNIFYLKKENLLKSKLHILNTVMLSGGNAGIQILHGQWDRHYRWEENDQNQNDETHLDKVAWNEGSVLWFAKSETNADGTPVFDAVTDSEGNTTYKVRLAETVQLPVTDGITSYLDLIPAEISGGDGQRLIAPHKDWMGMEFRYYLAPVKHDANNREVMDEEKAVEISYNHLVALIHKIIGPVEVFTEGKMYYSVPIPHRINTFSSTSNREAWRNFGAFSLVRNNWYNILVTEFTRMGTPVDNLDQPIVPVMDVKRSYINMGVEVLNWHEVIEDNIPMM